VVSYSKSHILDIPVKRDTSIRAPELNGSKCTKCGYCIDVCPQNVFSVLNDEYQVQQPENCIECGACVLNCKGDAIIFEAFPGCGCIWDATSRRLKSIAFWRKSAKTTPDSCCGT